MNPRTKRKMIQINARLEQFNQNTRIIDISPTSVILNTGHYLNGKNASKFIKRVMNTKILDWINNIDGLLSGTINEDEIKSISRSLGGKACQLKHGQKIKSNLNTGIPWNKNSKGNYPYAYKLSEESKSKISIANRGSGNGMYGRRMSENEKQKLSFRMKEKILSGEFTPNSNNRNTHWESTLDGIKYRSSWEALYKYINQNANYEELRVEYMYNGESKIYIVDFIDHVDKLVIEIKPNELWNEEKFIAKLEALTKWANQHIYKILLIDYHWLQKQNIQIDYDRFDEKTALKIRKLYETSKTY